MLCGQVLIFGHWYWIVKKERTRVKICGRGFLGWVRKRLVTGWRLA
jgi:hypothetical protein